MYRFTDPCFQRVVDLRQVGLGIPNSITNLPYATTPANFPVPSAGLPTLNPLHTPFASASAITDPIFQQALAIRLASLGIPSPITQLPCGTIPSNFAVPTSGISTFNPLHSPFASVPAWGGQIHPGVELALAGLCGTLPQVAPHLIPQTLLQNPVTSKSDSNCSITEAAQGAQQTWRRSLGRAIYYP